MPIQLKQKRDWTVMDGEHLEHLGFSVPFANLAIPVKQYNP